MGNASAVMAAIRRIGSAACRIIPRARRSGPVANRCGLGVRSLAEKALRGRIALLFSARARACRSYRFRGRRTPDAWVPQPFGALSAMG